MIDVYATGLSIDIGRQGENLARNIYFDLSDLIDNYGEGTATLVHMRPSDTAPYICEVERAGNFLIWAPTSTDTAYPGAGKCELRWVVGETLAKSIIYTTTIAPSITGAEGVPDPYKSWYDAIIAYIEANYAANGAPQEVRAAIYTLLSKAVYTETGLTDELAAVEAWASTSCTAIAVSPSTLEFNEAGQESTITATVAPEGCTDEITWVSSNTSVATVNDGVVTAVGNGSCTITATCGNHSATCTVSISGIAATYSIEYNLTNITSSNTASAVTEGGSYSSVLTANTGYLLGSVSVTMGGVDITSTTYNSGNISIPSVTGDIAITAAGVADSRTLIHSYDFTESLDDAVGTLTATLGNSSNGAAPTRDDNGLTFNASNQYCSFGTMAVINKEFEIDISAMNVQNTGQHTRVFMCTPYASQGTGALIYRQGSGHNYWSGYSGNTWSSPYSTTLARNGLAGKTVKLAFDGSGYCKFYLDGELIGTSSVAFSTASSLIVTLGGLTSGTSYSNNMTITGFRIYEVAA